MPVPETLLVLALRSLKEVITEGGRGEGGRGREGEGGSGVGNKRVPHYWRGAPLHAGVCHGEEPRTLPRDTL